GQPDAPASAAGQPEAPASATGQPGEPASAAGLPTAGVQSPPGAQGQTNGDGKVLLGVEHLQVYFPIRSGVVVDRQIGQVHAVDDVSFDLLEGETLGVVGESGCGKTTLIRALVRLIEPTAGSVSFDGDDITKLGRKQMEPIRREMQMVFQDPQGALTPRKRIGQILATPLRIRGVARNQIQNETGSLLDRVGLPKDVVNRFPHEFSGGQRQRIGIARALAPGADLIICDEAVSALDVSVKAQIINLLGDLQAELGLALLFISHDLAIVEHLTHRVAVMYLGKIVEIADRGTLFAKSHHPYNRALLSA